MCSNSEKVLTPLIFCMSDFGVGACHADKVDLYSFNSNFLLIKGKLQSGTFLKIKVA